MALLPIEHLRNLILSDPYQRLLLISKLLNTLTPRSIEKRTRWDIVSSLSPPENIKMQQFVYSSFLRTLEQGLKSYNEKESGRNFDLLSDFLSAISYRLGSKVLQLNV